jgi:hypothetical protein
MALNETTKQPSKSNVTAMLNTNQTKNVNKTGQQMDTQSQDKKANNTNEMGGDKSDKTA